MRMITGRNAIKVPCKRNDLPQATTERSIFYYLGVNHVFFKREQRLLYFSDLEQTPVISLLKTLDKEPWRNDATFETLYLDEHNYWFGGYRLALPERLSKPLLVALRMKGVVISYDLDAVSGQAAE